MLSSTNCGYLLGSGSSLLCLSEGGDWHSIVINSYRQSQALYFIGRGGVFHATLGLISAKCDCSIGTMLSYGYLGTTTASIVGTYHAASDSNSQAYVQYTITFDTKNTSYHGYWMAALAGNTSSNSLQVVNFIW